ncbi:hypothetical protein [Polaribacter sp. Z022]|uniref:hypothetical protein n=1 Tax=Polaribacter sp. Z022 TaxID=2927125 RepID=UPI002020E3DF|nr:hypothetical protein [Polaribacter sp. Z022]MCL7753130.1 hypothetical protein [Polaribacter sp. Z022]
MSLTFTSCAELLSALSSTNTGMGGKCSRNVVTTYAYNSREGKYESGTIIVVNRKGKNVATSERRWAQNKQREYINRGKYITYYDTSPYSGAKYKFSVYCSNWH